VFETFRILLGADCISTTHYAGMLAATPLFPKGDLDQHTFIFDGVSSQGHSRQQISPWLALG